MAALEREDELLFALAIAGPLAAARATEQLGGSEAELAALLEELARAGLVEARAALGGRFALTAEGRRRARAAIAEESGALGAAVGALYECFAARNGEVKQLLGRWQVRAIGGADVLNDHSDPAHDALVLRELGRWRTRAAAMLDELAGLRTRYVRYRFRLDEALERAGRGEIAYVSGLAVDSLHAIWWQLHADLLAILGRARGESDV